CKRPGGSTKPASTKHATVASSEERKDALKAFSIAVGPIRRSSMLRPGIYRILMLCQESWSFRIMFQCFTIKLKHCFKALFRVLALWFLLTTVHAGAQQLGIQSKSTVFAPKIPEVRS